MKLRLIVDQTAADAMDRQAYCDRSAIHERRAILALAAWVAGLDKTTFEKIVRSEKDIASAIDELLQLATAKRNP